MHGARAPKRPRNLRRRKQRVGIARAFAMEPVLLMDEPFGALDADPRRLQDDRRDGRPAPRGHGDHDVDEAVLLSDQIVVMMTNACGHHRRDRGGIKPRDRLRLHAWLR